MKNGSVIRENLLVLVQKDIPDAELKKELRKLVEDKVEKEVPYLCMKHPDPKVLH